MVRWENSWGIYFNPEKHEILRNNQSFNERTEGKGDPEVAWYVHSIKVFQRSAGNCDLDVDLCTGANTSTVWYSIMN